MLAVSIVMPAYNAASTLERTYSEIPHEVVDNIILEDDASYDNTVGISKSLQIQTIIHTENKGYGANQKTCYQVALEGKTDIIIMLHPDYQYTPKLITAMVSPLAEEVFDCMLGSRILGEGALKGGMPYYKFVANRFLTLIQNFLLNYKISEYHTGYRAYTREILESVNWQNNSDDFIFDNQILAQIIYAGYSIGEISCPSLYTEESSSINLQRSIWYGIGVLITSIQYRLSKWGIYKSNLFSE